MFTFKQIAQNSFHFDRIFKDPKMLTSRGQKRCYACNQDEDHFITKCPLIVCSFCKEKGHIVEFCQRRILKELVILKPVILQAKTSTPPEILDLVKSEQNSESDDEDFKSEDDIDDIKSEDVKSEEDLEDFDIKVEDLKEEDLEGNVQIFFSHEKIRETLFIFKQTPFIFTRF
mgnify:CR=1 FL=1